VRSGKVKDSLRLKRWKIQRVGGNFVNWTGFVTWSEEIPSKLIHAMSPMAHIRRFLPSLPRDYIRRRRAIRRITNVLLTAGLSLTTAYFITRSTGGTGFSAGNLATNRVTLPIAPHPEAAVPEAFPIEANGYELETSPYTVSEVEDLVLHDANRSKDLHVRIFYPNESGRYPVIVFSHGAGGSETCCDGLTRHWATHGYVTIQPTHDDSAVQRRNQGEENIRFMQAVRDALNKPALWESRPLDISYVLDALPSLENRVPGLAEEMDVERIGVGGHSMGSYTAEAIAGALVDLPGHPGRNFADSRVKAVLCLSPQGPGQFGLNEHSFDQVALPYLGVTGSLDSLGRVASPAWHKIPFERSQPGDKYHLFIEGANHMSFIAPRTLLPPHARQGREIFDYTNSAALAFWDAYLKGDARARAYLQSSELEKFSHGSARLSRR
jgi:predicted dienelactone hydrolase